MTFGRKIFVALSLLVTGACVLVGCCIFRMVRESRVQEYLSRYENLGHILAGTFYEMENLSDSVAQNALAVLRDKQKFEGLPDDPSLAKLAGKLHVMAFYAQNDEGYFIRSSDLPIEQQTNSLFGYSEEYRKLLTGEATVQQTPVIPSWPDNVPAKLTMIPMADRSGILEVSYHLEYLNRILQDIVRSDAHILSVGLFAPNGYQLGQLDRSGVYAFGIPDAMADTDVGHKLGKDSAQFNIKVKSSVETCPECTIKETQVSRGVYHYILRLTVSTAPLAADIAKAWQTIAAVAVTTALLASVLAGFIASSLVRGLKDITATAAGIVSSGNLALRVPYRGGKDESFTLAQTFNQMLTALSDSQERLVETERLQSIAKLASEVAHDIRSPIAALESVCKHASSDPESERYLVLEATKRIRDIANNLLTHHRDIVLSAPPKEATPELVVSVLQSAVSQKRAEFAYKDVEIDLEADDTASGAFVCVNLTDFKRTISNLLNNAVEAINRAGQVLVTVSRQDSYVHVAIRDNGCGMTPQQIQNARAGGYSSKGSDGNGIGLSSSIRRIAQWGGSIDVDSRPAAGTSISIRLPPTSPAAWFAPTLEIDPSRVTAIIDDDGFIGTLWRKRLLAAHPSIDESRIRFFRRSCDFLTFHATHAASVGTCLVDYEFVDSVMTGVKLVESLGIASQSYLVTSHDEDRDVRQQCVRLGLRMVPKTMVNQIDISCTNKATAGVKSAGSSPQSLNPAALLTPP